MLLFFRNEAFGSSFPFVFTLEILNAFYPFVRGLL